MGSARARVASGLFCAKFLRFTLTLIYINFDIQTKFEVNQTQIGHSIPKKLQKLTKVAISQNPILPKCHSPKSLLLLHFSMNLSETFRIDVNMDFAHTNHGRFFWILGSNVFWRSRLFGGVGFLVNDTWAKWGFEIWPLW